MLAIKLTKPMFVFGIVMLTLIGFTKKWERFQMTNA